MNNGESFKCGGAILKVLDDEPKQITNPYTGEYCTLTPEAIAVYDFIKGSEYLGLDFSPQLQYFMQKWPEAYMTLLD